MASTFILAPNPIWYIADQAGRPAGGAIMYPRSSLDNDVAKQVFMTPDGTAPWPFDAPDFGITFDDNGSQGPFYWEVNGVDNYYILITDKNGVILAEIPQYPIVEGGGSGPITTVSNINNLIIDGQFRFLSFTNPLNPIPSGQTTLEQYYSNNTLIGGWFFTTDVPAATNNLSFSRPSLSDTSPEANPYHVLTYQCLVAGSSGTRMDLGYRIKDVKSFSGQQITIQCALDSSGAPLGVQGEFYYVQNFGTGGSPSPQNVQTDSFVWPSSGYLNVSHTFGVDPVGGNSLGTNEDDYFEIGVRFPINSIGTYRATNFELVLGDKLPDNYLYETYSDTAYKVDALQPVTPTGFVMFSYDPTQISGWLRFQDGQSIGGPTSTATFKTSFMGISLFNLYTVWWNAALGTTGQPIVSPPKGVSALADWNAGKHIVAPLIDSRVLAAVQGTAFNTAIAGGADNKAIPLSALPGHTHNLTTIPAFNLVANVGTGPTTGVMATSPPTAHVYTTQSTGASGNFDVRQFTSYLWLFVKL